MGCTMTIWDEPIEVEVDQRSVSEWIISGWYLGQCIEVTRQSYEEAVRDWSETARREGRSTA